MLPRSTPHTLGRSGRRRRERQIGRAGRHAQSSGRAAARVRSRCRWEANGVSSSMAPPGHCRIARSKSAPGSYSGAIHSRPGRRLCQPYQLGPARGVHATQTALEAEADFGRCTVRGIAGAEFGNSHPGSAPTTVVVPPAVGVPGVIATNSLVQTIDVNTRFMDQINLQYYPTDNWETPCWPPLSRWKERAGLGVGIAPRTATGSWAHLVDANTRLT